MKLHIVRSGIWILIKTLFSRKKISCWDCLGSALICLEWGIYPDSLDILESHRWRLSGIDSWRRFMWLRLGVKKNWSFRSYELILSYYVIWCWDYLCTYLCGFIVKYHDKSRYLSLSQCSSLPEVESSVLICWPVEVWHKQFEWWVMIDTWWFWENVWELMTLCLLIEIEVR